MGWMEDAVNNSADTFQAPKSKASSSGSWMEDAVSNAAEVYEATTPGEVGGTDWMNSAEKDSTQVIPAKTKVSKSSAAWQGFVDEISFGFSDEISAGVEAIWSDKDYEELVAEERKEIEQAEIDNPEAFWGGKATGFGASLLIPGGIFVKGGGKALGYSKGLINAAKGPSEAAIVSRSLIQQATKEGNSSLAGTLASFVSGKGIKIDNLPPTSRTSWAGGSKHTVELPGAKNMLVDIPRNVHRSIFDARITAPLGLLHGVGSTDGDWSDRLKGGAVGLATGLVPPALRGGGKFVSGAVGLGGLSYLGLDPVRKSVDEFIGKKDD